MYANVRCAYSSKTIAYMHFVSEYTYVFECYLEFETCHVAEIAEKSDLPGAVMGQQ
jgi:hypothetical protein